MDDLWTTKSEDVGLIVRAISLVSKIFNLCGHNRLMSQTDRLRQTDDMRSQDRALHYSASRSKTM